MMIKCTRSGDIIYINSRKVDAVRLQKNNNQVFIGDRFFYVSEDDASMILNMMEVDSDRDNDFKDNLNKHFRLKNDSL